MAAVGTGTVLLLLAAAGLSGGCSALGYYGQAMRGHLDLVQRSRPVNAWLADETTPQALRERLVLSQRIRDFAVSELKLPDSRSYRSYADLGRNAVVWNLVAAPELSLELKTWCFAIVGCVGYRGWFSEAPPRALAEELRAQGWETHVYGVPAYSTLGRTEWLGGDPLLNTFIRWPEGELARLIFHELAHHVVYVRDDTTFNESYATAVERIGVRRWLQQHAGEAARAEYAALDARREDFRRLAQTTRAELQALYAAGGEPEALRARKAEILAGMRARHLALKEGPWAGFAGYDAWFAQANNATLAVQAAYDELVSDFEALFERSGRDFTRFHTEVKALAALPAPERRATLATRP